MRGLKHEESPPAFLTSGFSLPSHLSHTFISLFTLPKLPSTAFIYIMGKQIRERETVNSALPPLLMTDFHTSSNAVHPLVYNGDMNHWPNFFQNVRATMDNQHWSSSVIGYTLKTHNLDDNKDFVGDETGVQGRFQQAIGQTLGQAFEAQRLDIRFADSKCLPNPGGKVPDCTMKTSRNELKLVGELKVPWVVHHRIERRLKFEPFCQNSHFRVLVGQILGYMKETGVYVRLSVEL
ncbi:hypothetical protein DTO012A7_1965 [Penicillium roqueforti]|nr:hypothetical protein DTO012A7_1965 [Penicillium roqueforti]